MQKSRPADYLLADRRNAALSGLRMAVEPMQTVADWLATALTARQRFIIEQRFGLSDPLFRPYLRRPSLREVGEQAGGLSRERVRQLQNAALERLRATLPPPLLAHWTERIRAAGGAVDATHLRQWAAEPLLGGYGIWGVLTLLAAISPTLHHRHGVFTILPATQCDQWEAFALLRLQQQGRPMTASELADASHAAVLDRLLAHHPAVDRLTDGRYFLPAAAPTVIAEIIRERGEPTTLEELVAIYNARMMPGSERKAGFIRRTAARAPGVERLASGIYRWRG